MQSYRQFYVHPYDFSLRLVFTRIIFYCFDVVLPIGLRSSVMACQRITNGILYICSQHGFDVLIYLDNFQGIEMLDKATIALDFLQSLLVELGVKESQSKACPWLLTQFF